MHLNKFIPIHNQYKENIAMKLKPGIFSNQANITAHYHQEYNQRPKSPSPYHQEQRNNRISNENTSFESLSRINTQITSDNEVFASMFDNNNYSEIIPEQNIYIYEQGRSARPLQERTNQPLLRDSRNMPTYTARHGSSEKQPRKQSVENQPKLKKNTSYGNLKGNSNSGQKYSKSNNIKAKSFTPGNQSYAKLARQPFENDENTDVNSFLGASKSSSNITHEKRKSNNFIEPFSAYDSVATEDLERIKREKNELQLTINKLTEDLQAERTKTELLETELNSLTTSITEERAKYQGELLKISQQIKKLRNIQAIYVNEKKNSERLESELNEREKTCADLANFLNLTLSETLKAILTTLELLLIKGDYNIEKHLQDQEFSIETDYLKLLYEIRRILLPKVENAEVLDIPSDWKINDYKQIIANTKELMRIRKSTNFKLNTDKMSAYNSTERKSTSASTYYNSKPMSARSTSPLTQHLNNLPTYASNTNLNTNATYTFSITNNTCNYSPGDYQSNKREEPNYTSLASGYNSRGATDLRSARAQPLEYVPFNSRVDVIERFTHREREEHELLESKEETEPETFNQESFTTKKLISPSKFPEAIVEEGASLGSTIQPRADNCSAFNETFDNLIAERFHEENSRKLQSEYNSNASKNYDLPLAAGSHLTFQNQSNSKAKNDLDAIKSKILQRKMEIETRKSNNNIEPVDIYKQNIMENSNESHSRSSICNETKNIETVPKEEHNHPVEYAPLSNRIGLNPVASGQKQGPQENITLDGSTIKEPPKTQEIQGSGVKDKSNKNSPLVQKVNPSSVNNSPFQKASATNTAAANTSNFYSNSSMSRLSPPRSEQKNTPDQPKPTSEITMNQFAIAKFDYNPQKENDLKFKRGDKIQILKKTESGWWIGLCNNKIGYFPYNFVSLMD